MSREMRMVPLLHCIGCHKSNVTLKKIDGGDGTLRMCLKCESIIRDEKELLLPDGTFKMVLEENELSFIEVEKEQSVD